MREELQSLKRVKHETRKSPMRKNKFVYTMEDSEDADTSEDEETEILFMGLDTQASNSDSDVEGEVELRVELVSTLEELDKCRKKNK